MWSCHVCSTFGYGIKEKNRRGKENGFNDKKKTIKAMKSKKSYKKELRNKLSADDVEIVVFLCKKIIFMT